jgi:sulfite reductase (ferredoxin)
MKYADLEATVEPIFAMYKGQRNAAGEAFGDFCHRVGWDAIKGFMETYQPGDHKTIVDPFAPPLLPAPSSSVGIDAALKSTLEQAAAARGLDANTLLDAIVREALEE